MNWFDGEDLNWNLTWYGFDQTNEIGPFGPAGVGTFVLDLEQGFKIKHRWPFDLQKFQSGKERRISRNDAAQEFCDGSAILLGHIPRSVRATMARYAAQGQPFLFGLAHEEIQVTDVSGSTLTVVASQLALTDWTRPGQRCVVVWLDDENETQYSEATIQAVSSPTIELDIAPNSRTQGIMPTRPVLLEPQQSFPRYPVNAEVWSLATRSAIFDFAPTLASVPIRDPDEIFPDTGARAYARVFGAAGNTKRLVIVEGGGYAATGELVSETDTTTTIGVNPGVTTLGDLAILFESSANFSLGGSYTDTDTIQWDQDELATGGSITGDVGTGATVTTYQGDGAERLVWDRPITGERATDSVQAMTHVLDHGAVPYAIGTADQPDYGRAIALGSGDLEVWQWLKKFLSTTIGAQNAFWLPTWRDDMDWVSTDTTTIDVEIEDLSAWWPYQREHLQIEENDGTITYAKISAAVDNGDGTWTLTTIDADGNPAIPSGSVKTISWLELCRFADDEFEFSFNAAGVSLETVARVVKDIQSNGFREYASISYGPTTHNIAFSDRDLVVGGVIYTAIASDHGSVSVPATGSQKDLTLTLPIDHAFVSRYMQQGIPPSKIAVTIYRQNDDLSTEQRFSGEVDGVSFDDECTEATFRIVSSMSRIALRTIPSIVVGRSCAHTLFEGMCGNGITRDGTNPDGVVYKCTTTVLFADGRDVKVDLTNVPAAYVRRAQWCVLGELVHTASGERRTISGQADLNPGTGTVTYLSLHVPIVEMRSGDSVDIYPGCDHDLRGDYGCNLMFGNRQNFGGFPMLPDKDPFIPGSPGSES